MTVASSLKGVNFKLRKYQTPVWWPLLEPRRLRDYTAPMSQSLSHSSSFVGRQQEMARLTAALDDAIYGQGRIVMLAGEPGIGKTRTARELSAHAEGKYSIAMPGFR